MKKVLQENLFDITIIVSFTIIVILSYLLNFIPVIEITENNFLNFIVEMVSFLPPLFILIGLFDVWVPKEAITKHIGANSGIKGTITVILLATLQAGPLYAAFPVAHLLWKKGCSIKNIFIYLGAFSAFKIPMLTFEIAFLGIKFSFLRAVFTIPIFIAIGFYMEHYFKNKKFSVSQG